MDEEMKEGKREELGEDLRGRSKRTSHIFPGLRKLPTKKITLEGEETSSEETVKNKEPEEKPTGNETPAQRLERVLGKHGREDSAGQEKLRRRLTISLPKVRYESYVKMKYYCSCKAPHEFEFTHDKDVEKNVFCDVCGRRYILKINVEITGQD